MKAVRNRCLFTALCLAMAMLLHSLSFAQDEKEPQPRVVKNILKVDYDILQSEPPNLFVTATGEVSTGGYSKVKLLRVVYVTPPEDGIQDYILFAVPPSGPATQVISQVEAKDIWKAYTKEAPWLKGIRVHGIDDGIVVKMIKK